MLTPDQAKAALDQHRVKDSDRRQLRAIAELPEHLRILAYALLNRDENGKYIRTPNYLDVPTGGQSDYLREAALRLDALPADERGQIFAAFFPTLAPQVELAWQFQRGQPYDGSALFRAPQRPEATAHGRAQWLVSLSNAIGAYQQDILWLASYAPYLGYATHLLGPLFAAVIERDPAQGDALYAILVASARGEHETGGMGRHLPSALLAASRPNGWEVVERMLLGAQREEGVRQVILEALPEAHPQALRRLLRLVLEQNLARFSAVTLAANQWLGATWDSSQAPAVNRALSRLLELLEDDAARAEALATGSGEDVSLALTAHALSDVEAALPPALTLAGDPQVERRFAGVHFLAHSHLPESRAPLLEALLDPDPRVVARASAGLIHPGEWGVTPDEFERIEVALAHLPARPVPVQPLLWSEPSTPADRERIADLLLSSLGERDPRRLIPHLGSLSQYGRVRAAHALAQAGGDDPTIRTVLLDLLGDRASWVREQVSELLAKRQIRAADAPALEALLTRKSADLRRSLLTLLLKQPDAAALASVDRLLAAKAEPQRLAGLEALRLLAEAQRQPAECIARATAYERAHPDLSAAARAQLAPILDTQREVPTLKNALGLADPAACVAPPAPVAHPRPLFTPAAVAALQSLDALIEEHRTTPYTAETYRGTEEVLLGGDTWRFPSPDPTLPTADDTARLPLADLWRTWAETRADPLRDADGFEFARMLLLLTRRGADELRALLLAGLTSAESEIPAESATPSPSLPVGERAGERVPAESATSDLLSPRGGEVGREVRLTLRHANLLRPLCLWLMRLYPAPSTADFLLDHLETTLAEIPESQLRSRKADSDDQPYYRNRYQRLDEAVGAVRTYRTWVDAAWSEAHAARLWRLLRWSEGLGAAHLRYAPTLEETLAAHQAGACGETDLTMHLLGSRYEPTYASYVHTNFGEVGQFTARKPHHLLAEYPVLGPIVAQCRQRVLEVELARGEMPTAATPAALSLRSVLGIAWFARLIAALEGQRFTRGGSYRESGKAYTLSHLLRVSFPTPEETPMEFAEAVRAASIPEARLIEAAVYAPQWARSVEHVLGWQGFTQAVWWIYAHTRDRGWEVDSDVRAEWQAQIAEWTPLASDDLYDGAVDVAWFGRVYATLGAARWQALYAAAKYASSGGGHARAQLFADAMLGRVEERALSERITAKRNRDAVCALGLVPLPAKASAREAAILRRYQTLQAFLRTSRSFGAQRRENDGKAARIGLENLARTAGYSDPQRFQWAMELREAEDLRGGVLTLIQGPVTVTLRIDSLGQPHIEVEKAGKALKDIPATLKKVPEVAALRERKKTLEQQLTRMRLTLEQTMCRAESFPVAELACLLEHPILAPLLEQLIFTGEAGMGYLVAGGRALRAHDGQECPLKPEATLRIAHPHDLYHSGAWSQWQRECFTAERIQPFKQVFRELYPLSQAEQRAEGRRSQRYAGQQIQPKQAMALLGQRGWLTGFEEGGATRTFHERGITAEVGFLYGGGTSVDVEGLTIEEVSFHQAGETWGKPLALAEVPPILFSEVMRDLDLVVSVAHRGGVDPEGSASTVEMRTALLREVGAALGLENVRLRASHAIVRGSLGEYSVHLGSGVVHLLPGGALCIIPVHAQHRGRVFLPFADDDPKTAEIISKVVLLARDSELKDPLILEQIYARA